MEPTAIELAFSMDEVMAVVATLRDAIQKDYPEAERSEQQGRSITGGITMLNAIVATACNVSREHYLELQGQFFDIVERAHSEGCLS